MTREEKLEREIARLEVENKALRAENAGLRQRLEPASLASKLVIHGKPSRFDEDDLVFDYVDDFLETFLNGEHND